MLSHISTEVLADGEHLSPELLRFAFQFKGPENLCLVTDASRAVDMPVGDYHKDEIRQIAEEIGLMVAHKKDSMEICFIPDDDYDKFLKLIDESGTSSWELLQNCYTMKDFHEQKITRTLALTQLFLKKIGAGVCRVHGGGFAGVIAAIVPEKEQDNYVEYISRFVGKENVYPMDIRAIGAVHIG